MSKKAWIISTHFARPLACALEQDVLRPSKDIYLFAAKNVDLELLTIKKSWGWHAPYGLVCYFDFVIQGGAIVKKAILKIYPLKLSARKYWGMIGFRKQRGLFYFETFKSEGDFHPPLLQEKMLSSHSQTDINGKRIEYLIHSHFEFVDKREARESILYKDKKDGRFWQLLPLGDDKKILQVVSASQWQYEYLENRYFPKDKGEESDKEFYEALQIDPVQYPCEETNCQNLRIKYGSLCKDHHFYALKGHYFQKSQ